MQLQLQVLVSNLAILLQNMFFFLVVSSKKGLEQQ